MAVGLEERSVYKFPFMNFMCVLKDIQIKVKRCSDHVTSTKPRLVLT